MNQASLLIRNIIKLILGKQLFAQFVKWTIDGSAVMDTAKIFFIDGVTAFTSDADVLLGLIPGSNFGIIGSNAEDIIKLLNMQSGDVVLGRPLDGNYILFRAGSSMAKGKELILSYDTFNLMASSFKFNSGMNITSEGGKLFINGKEIAVIGGTVDPTDNTIITSGQ